MARSYAPMVGAGHAREQGLLCQLDVVVLIIPTRERVAAFPRWSMGTIKKKS